MVRSRREDARGHRYRARSIGASRGFTLLQLLTLAAVVGIVAGLLLPVLLEWLGFNV